MTIDKLRIVNWNVGGAKYLQLRSEARRSQAPNPERDDREWSRDTFRELLNNGLHALVQDHDPHIITMQEVTAYEPNGKSSQAESIVNLRRFPDYELFWERCIDTEHHSHQGKWDKVRKLGEWGKNAYFAQGNGILVHKELTRQMFPVMSIPRSGITRDEWLEEVRPKMTDLASRFRTEDVLLDPGLYMGDRDTEPRKATVIHFSLDMGKAQDIFVINTHLTTLTYEREGIPQVDAEATRRRLTQLATIFDRIISPYNMWRRKGFILRDDAKAGTEGADETDRHRPVWIISGDMNFTPSSDEYRYILDRNFIDLVDPPKPTKASGLGGDPTHTLDYVFLGPMYYSIDPIYLKGTLSGNSVRTGELTKTSDHFPILVTIPFRAFDV